MEDDFQASKLGEQTVVVTFAKTGYSGVAAGREGVQDVPIWGTGELEAPMGCPGEGGARKCLGKWVWGSI